MNMRLIIYFCSLTWWKCLSTSYLFCLSVIFLKTESKKPMNLGGLWLTQEFCCFWRASCLLCYFLGLHKGQGAWRGSRSPPGQELCAEDIVFERLILCVAGDPWNAHKHFCRFERCSVADGSQTRLCILCLTTRAYSLFITYTFPI